MMLGFGLRDGRPGRGGTALNHNLRGWFAVTGKEYLK